MRAIHATTGTHTASPKPNRAALSRTPSILKSGAPWSRAYSVGVIHRTRTLPRPASTTACLLDPPRAVRRQPLTASGRISQTARPLRVLRYAVAHVSARPSRSRVQRCAWIGESESRNRARRSAPHQRASAGDSRSTQSAMVPALRPGDGSGSACIASFGCPSTNARTHAGRNSEIGHSAGTGSASRAPTTNRRGRLCGTNHLASSVNRSQRYPRSLRRWIAAAMSLPPCEVAKPTTFSSMTTRGRRFPISVRTRANSQNTPEPSPASPARLPASDRSVQGNDAVARSTLGTSRPRTPRTSPRTKCSASKLAAYIAYLSGSMSLAKATSKPSLSMAARTRPIPAKNSAARSVTTVPPFLRLP